MGIASGGKLAEALPSEPLTKYSMNRTIVLISALIFSIVNVVSLFLILFPKIQEGLPSAWFIISIFGSLSGSAMGLSLFFYFLNLTRNAIVRNKVDQ